MRWRAIAELFGGKNSQATHAHSLSDASYALRGTLFTLQLSGFSHPAAGIPFIGNMLESMTLAQPETKFSAYANYVDSTLSKEEAHRLYYGLVLREGQRASDR